MNTPVAYQQWPAEAKAAAQTALEAIGGLVVDVQRARAELADALRVLDAVAGTVYVGRYKLSGPNYFTDVAQATEWARLHGGEITRFPDGDTVCSYR